MLDGNLAHNKQYFRKLHNNPVKALRVIFYSLLRDTSYRYTNNPPNNPPNNNRSYFMDLYNNPNRPDNPPV